MTVPTAAEEELSATPAMRVYRFGVRGDLPPEAIEELYRCHRLQNTLIEYFKDFQADIDRVWAQYPELQQADGLVRCIEVDLELMTSKTKRARMEARSTRVPGDLKAQVKATRGELREARAARKVLKDRIYPIAKPQIAEAAQRRKRRIKDLYGEAVADGLYWANFNEVAQHHETAIKAVKRKRAAGQPADLRFRRWDGTGTLTVQLQRAKDKPARTPELLASDHSPWAKVAHLGPALDETEWVDRTRSERVRLSRQGKLTFRIGANEEQSWVEVPVILHRPIPSEADVTLVRISRRRIASRFQVYVSVVVRLPEIPARTSGSVVAVHGGWRALPDGSIRVAVTSGAGPVPEQLRDVVRNHGDWQEIVVPGAWMKIFQRPAQLRSQRDKNMEVLRQELVGWLAEHQLDDDEREMLAHVDKWRSPGRFAALALRWRENPPEGGEDIATVLEAWRKQDKHLWEWEANERDQLLGRRNNAFANVAAWLTHTAVALRLDGWQISPLVRVPAPEDEDGWQDRAARANRMMASPGRLSHALGVAASARGVHLQTVDSPISQTHFGCGGLLSAEDRAADILVPCTQCGEVLDQDYNSLQHLLQPPSMES